LRELGSRDFGAVAELAGLEILAEDAAQIAPAEKDRAGAVPATQTIFLTEMRKCTGDACEPSAFAHTNLVVEPVDFAIARANLARSQRFDCLFGALLKNSLLECAHVCRNKIFTRQDKSSAAAQLKRRGTTEIDARVHRLPKLNVEGPTLNPPSQGYGVAGAQRPTSNA
jgi:hypothetical protein